LTVDATGHRILTLMMTGARTATIAESLDQRPVPYSTVYGICDDRSRRRTTPPWRPKRSASDSSALLARFAR
jgi:hypothetical protein